MFTISIDGEVKCESAVIEVRRPEHKIVKLLLFAKRHADLDRAEFQARWAGTYGALARNAPGILGCVVNFPTPLDVMTGFFSEESGAFEASAMQRRSAFLDQFDGMPPASSIT